MANARQLLAARAAAFGAAGERRVDWIGSNFVSNDASKCIAYDTGFAPAEWPDRNPEPGYTIMAYYCEFTMMRPNGWTTIWTSYVSETAPATRVICANGSATQLYVGYKRQANKQTIVSLGDFIGRRVTSTVFSTSVDTAAWFSAYAGATRLYDASIAVVHSGVNNATIKLFGGAATTGECEVRIHRFHVSPYNHQSHTYGPHYVDLVPVVVGGEPMFRDLVGGRLIRNIGLGTPQVGPEVSV